LAILISGYQLRDVECCAGGISGAGFFFTDRFLFHVTGISWYNRYQYRKKHKNNHSHSNRDMYEKCCYGASGTEVGIPIVPTFLHFLNLLVHPDIAGMW